MADIDPQTILNDSQAYADSLKSTFESNIDRLNSIAAGHNTWVDFAPRVPYEPEKVGHVPEETLPELEPAVFGAEFGDPASDIDKYREHVFVAPMLDSLQSLLWGWVSSGGVGISDDVQTSMWENMRERDRQTLADTLDAIADNDAKRGFRYSTKRRASNVAITQYGITRDNRNYEITMKIGEWAQQNVQNAVAQNISIEQLQSAFSLGISGIFQTIKGRIIDKFRVEQEARIAEVESKRKAIISGYELQIKNADLDIGQQKLLADIAMAELADNTARTNALIQQAAHETAFQLGAIGAEVQAVSAQLSSALLQTNGIVVSTR